MVTVKATIVPPGGGEADYSTELNMDTVPRVGEYIVFNNPNEAHFGAFKVLYVTYFFDSRKDGDQGHIHNYRSVEIQVAPVKYITGSDPEFGGDFYFNNPRWSSDIEEYPNSGY